MVRSNRKLNTAPEGRPSLSRQLFAEAVHVQAQFAEDLLGQGWPALSMADLRGYLEHVADRRLALLARPLR